VKREDGDGGERTEPLDAYQTRSSLHVKPNAASFGELLLSFTTNVSVKGGAHDERRP
jgi:hypothetical protein